METNCRGEHQIFVAEVVAVDSLLGMLRKLVVVNVCRSCGEVTFHEHQVSKRGVPITFTKEKEKQNEFQLQR